MSFDKEKKEFLGKKDKSIKGSIDIKIKSLVDKINSLDDFFTTSSCSGRIILLVRHSSGRKDKSGWIFTSHKKASFEEMKKYLINLPTDDVWFKMEAAILHVACKDIEKAKKFLNLARDTGFRRSGIISLGKNRISMELISTENIDTIVGRGGKLLIDDSYLKELIKEGNKKLEKSWEKIKKLLSKINEWGV